MNWFPATIRVVPRTIARDQVYVRHVVKGQSLCVFGG